MPVSHRRHPSTRQPWGAVEHNNPQGQESHVWRNSPLNLHACAGRVWTTRYLDRIKQPYELVVPSFSLAHLCYRFLRVSQAARRRASLPDADRDGAVGTRTGPAPVGGVQRAQRGTDRRGVSGAGTAPNKIATLCRFGLDSVVSWDFCGEVLGLLSASIIVAFTRWYDSWTESEQTYVKHGSAGPGCP